MPKDRVEAAIKRAISKDEKDFSEVLYEGMAPHGVAVVIETATDNPVRTVANLRAIFSKKVALLVLKECMILFLLEKAFLK